MTSILSKLRKQKGLSQEDVAEMMLVSVRTVSNWERTMRFKIPEDLHDLLDVYGVDYPERCKVIQEVYGNFDCKAWLPCISQRCTRLGEDK